MQRAHKPGDQEMPAPASHNADEPWRATIRAVHDRQRWEQRHRVGAFLNRLSGGLIYKVLASKYDADKAIYDIGPLEQLTQQMRNEAAAAGYVVPADGQPVLYATASQPRTAYQQTPAHDGTPVDTPAAEDSDGEPLRKVSYDPQVHRMLADQLHAGTRVVDGELVDKNP